MYLCRCSAPPFPPTYLTPSLSDIHSFGHDFFTTLAWPSFALLNIQANWNLPIDAIFGFRGLVMPYGEMETWDTKLVPALAVLSAATMAQGREVSGLIVGAVNRRGGKVG
jgi:hypothetical protein